MEMTKEQAQKRIDELTAYVADIEEEKKRLKQEITHRDNEIDNALATRTKICVEYDLCY